MVKTRTEGTTHFLRVRPGIVARLKKSGDFGGAISARQRRMQHVFKARLIGRGPAKAWAFLPIPAAVTQHLATRARVPVAGTMNGASFRSSLMPQGDGSHAMMVNQDLRTRAGATIGDMVSVSLGLDVAPRTVTVPTDLASKFAPDAARRFAALSYSHRKEYVDWITSARKPETRARRVEETIKRLGAGSQPGR
jgi:hypothetical protein